MMVEEKPTLESIGCKRGATQNHMQDAAFACRDAPVCRVSITVGSENNLDILFDSKNTERGSEPHFVTQNNYILSKKQ